MPGGIQRMWQGRCKMWRTRLVGRVPSGQVNGCASPEPVTNRPAPTERPGTEPPYPPPDLEEIIRLYGLRMWVEQSYRHVKHALGWSQYQVRSDQAIRRHWQLVWCAFSFCWYHASHLTSSPTQETKAPLEPDAPLPTSVPADTAGTGKKNQRGKKHASPSVLASGAPSGSRLVGTLDHA